MLKILIVDDENIVRRGIRQTIDWENYGFQIVGEATDGSNAIELFDILQPDIIITDIRMSCVDGLELISLIKKTGVDVELVILTGYDDFSYAKAALDQGVSAYLLKPVKNNELLGTMLSLKTKIENKRQTKVAMKTYISHQKSNLLLELINEKNITSEEIERKCNKYNITLPNYRYLISKIEIDNAVKVDGSINKVYLKLKECVDYYISINERYILSCSIDSHIILLIFEHPNYQRSSILELLNSIRRQFTSLSDFTVTIGTSGIFHNLNTINRGYQQAIRALEQKAVLGNDRIIDYTKINDSENISLNLSENQIDEIILAIKNMDRDTIFRIINVYFSQVSEARHVNIGEVKYTILELSVLIIRSTIKNINTMQTIFHRIPQPAFELQRLETIKDIQKWISDFLNDLLNSTEIFSPYRYKPIIQQAILYIMSDYAASITVGTVADKLFVSAAHLMRCFKNDTGKTFTEYLSEYRIKMAIQLLKEGKYRVYEIGNLVGYQDSKYFSKLFKKLTGHSPKYYSGSS